MSGTEHGSSSEEDALERALADVEERAATGDDHEDRLRALERLHDEVDAALDERDGESRSDR
ncbi:MAG: hypothetical protein M3P18_23970 [Actinomycetota bacterium]|nr:hypothetical protein [Actinomycetota bacterium]